MIEVNNEEELIALLEKHGFKTKSWGIPPQKSISDLWHEIEIGETQLTAYSSDQNLEIHEHATELESGDLLRIVSIVSANVYFIKNGKKLELTEDRRVFKDGTINRRVKENSVSEKIVQDEQPSIAIKRALHEELSLNEGFEISTVPVVRNQLFKSNAFQDLKTLLTNYTFEVTLSEEAFNPNGYVEYGEKKDIYFVWRNLNSPA